MAAHAPNVIRFISGSGATQSRLEKASPTCPDVVAKLAKFAESQNYGIVGLSPATCQSVLENVSLWHDIRLRNSCDSCTTYNFVVEIPYGELSKAEVSLEAARNQIQDNPKATQKLNAFEFAPSFNYGILPQTYCDPGDQDELGIGGDGAPLDCVELSGTRLQLGGVHEVIVLGALCVKDKGALDWKILTVCQSVYSTWFKDPLEAYSKLENSILSAMSWFERWYQFKNPMESHYPYGNEVLPQTVALNRIYKAHVGWQRLLSEKPVKFWFSPCALQWHAEEREPSPKKARI